MKGTLLSTLTGILLLTSFSAFAFDSPELNSGELDAIYGYPYSSSSQIPPCLDRGQALPVENQQVMTWKHSTANQFLARARVTGTITRLFPDRNGHNHFEIQIAPTSDGTLEIVYNQSFGALPALSPGMSVEACGDYITSIAQSGSYPPSPDGAILHWIHRNPSGRGHASGYLIINGALYGQENGSGALE
jgi:hypothetical protein